MVSQIGSLALSIASGLILSTFFFLIYYRLTKDKIFIDLSERSIIATCLSIFLAVLPACFITLFIYLFLVCSLAHLLAYLPACLLSFKLLFFEKNITTVHTLLKHKLWWMWQLFQLSHPLT